MPQFIPPASFVLDLEGVFRNIVRSNRGFEIAKFLENCYIEVLGRASTVKEFLSTISKVVGVSDVRVWLKLFFIRPPGYVGPYDVVYRVESQPMEQLVLYWSRGFELSELTESEYERLKNLRLAILFPMKLRVDENVYSFTFHWDDGWDWYRDVSDLEYFLLYMSIEGRLKRHVLVAPKAISSKLKELASVLGYVFYSDFVKELIPNLIKELSREAVSTEQRAQEAMAISSTALRPGVESMSTQAMRERGVGAPSREGILREIRGFRARDVLEGVVAKVLRDLGFEVRVDYLARARDGAAREVDVWAWKIVEGVPFRVYVSCKNLDREVGAPIIDQETGRVSQLLETPNIKFIVASRFNENGRKAAVADGFIPIEIGFKVDESNAVEAYERVYSVMNTVFTAIAPKKLQQLAETLAKIANELKRVGEELSRLVK